MTGICDQWLDERCFGLIRAGSKSYIALCSDVQMDDAGRRYLIPGEPVTFEVHHTRLDRAVEVVPDFRESEPIQPEIVTVYSWNGTMGWGKREVGGNLFFHRNEIITMGEETITEGTKLLVVAAGPLRSTDKSWIATRIEIYMPEEAHSEVTTQNVEGE
jgi:cold shock CspA family protein